MGPCIPGGILVALFVATCAFAPIRHAKESGQRVPWLALAEVLARATPQAALERLIYWLDASEHGKTGSLMRRIVPSIAGFLDWRTRCDGPKERVLVCVPSGGSADHFPWKAATSTPTSIFCIGIIAAVTRWIAAASLLAKKSSRAPGTICHERPKRSLSQPH